MVIPPFEVGLFPRILFGEGTLERVPSLTAGFGSRALVVTGARSFVESPRWTALRDGIEGLGVVCRQFAVAGEPSPEIVDEAVSRFGPGSVDVVVGIGGGSALDAAKAVAGLLPHGNSVMAHLEGIEGQVPYRGPSVPMIAVPTTAGTGSEATRNAVLSRRGPGGFKRSFRHECLVPRYAVVDPSLLDTCPPELIAADGMDAVTQLVESFVSSRSNPLTRAIARSGLEAAREGLWDWFAGGDRAPRGRVEMAYAALVSGIVLAQTGLGAVHGMASPLGAFFPIPHGVACGTLLAAATEANIAALESRAPDHPALEAYALLGSLLAGRERADARRERRALLETLEEWTSRLDLPGLGRFGVEASDLARVVAGSRGSSMKTNPVELTDAEIEAVLRRRL